ncbi:MAG: YceI family protein [Planctomycetota bacterium]
MISERTGERAVRTLVSALTLATGGVIAGSAAAEAVTYDFADPKGVNGVMFVLDSELEPFVGIGGGISGEVTYDAEDPTSFSGAISLDATTLQLVNGRMTDVMFGADWLNTEERATITVTFHGVASVDVAVPSDAEPAAPNEAEPETDKLYVDGTLTFGPFSIDKQFVIEPTVIEDGGTDRGAGAGDLLVLRSVFTVDRFDLGIENPGVNKVARSIEITVPIAGYAKASE